MKYRKMLILLLLAAVLAAGCGKAPEATEPPAEVIQTQPVTQPPTEAVTEPTAYELADFQALFDWDNAWVYNMAAGHAYGRAEDADLYYIFYNGVGCDGSWGSISAAEGDLLVSRGFWNEMDIQIMPAHLLDEALQKYFGLGLRDVKIPAEWVYSADTDTYYSNHNDAYGSLATVEGFEALADGTVRLYLTVDAVHDHDFEEVVWDAAMEMTLRPAEDGWQIVSNVFPARETVDRQTFYQNLLRWDSGFAYHRALGSIFNTPEDADLYYFFYNGTDVSARWEMLNDEERNLLLAAGFREDMDLQMLPGTVMDAQLREYFGLGLDAFEIPDEWVCDPESEVWYSNHNDTWLPSATVTDFEEFEDGTVRLYLTVDALIDHTGEFVYDAETVLTLRKTEDGYIMVTHAFALDVI